MTNEASYKKPLIFAVILHLIIFVALFIHFIPKMHLGPGAETKIINATVVNTGKMHPMHKPVVAKKPPIPTVQPDLQKAEQLAAAKAAQQQAQLAAQKAAEEHQKQLAQQKAEQEKQAKLAELKAQEHAALVAKRKAEQQKKHQLAQQLKAAQQQMMQQQLAQEQKQLTTASEAAANNEKIQSEIDKYKALILQAIGQNWLIPDSVDKNLSCILMIQLAPDGTVLGVQISKSSGDTALDQSATSAVQKASPLPVPNDPQLFDKFRNLRLTVRPKDIIN